MSLLTTFFSAAAGMVAPMRQPPADARDASQIIERFIRVLMRLSPGS